MITLANRYNYSPFTSSRKLKRKKKKKIKRVATKKGWKIAQTDLKSTRELWGVRTGRGIFFFNQVYFRDLLHPVLTVNGPIDWTCIKINPYQTTKQDLVQCINLSGSPAMNRMWHKVNLKVVYVFTQPLCTGRMWRKVNFKVVYVFTQPLYTGKIWLKVSF